jgi:signal transduction histidine kinase/HD-like signal output (HDOD) protein
LETSAEEFSVRRLALKLPVQLLRDLIFCIEVISEAYSDIEPSRKELILHSLAAACCAEAIAETVTPRTNSQLAYSAGLLHNIGNLALHQAMPKSFARIVEEAKSEDASICAIEQRHLGVDYTILGKRLAQKWHLPNEIALAIWLHRSKTAAIGASLPEARLAQIVRAADSIARHCGIGYSGSYDAPDSIDRVARQLGMDIQQVEQIRRDLPEHVAQQSKVLGFSILRPEAAYRDALRGAAAQLASDNSKLSEENRRLQTASGYFDFVKDFLLSVDPNSPPVDIAENFAVRWQKFYQTGTVCLYLVPQTASKLLEAVVVETLAQAKAVLLKAPVGLAAVPKTISSNFAVSNAHDRIGWLFEQLDVDFELSQTKLVPLLAGGRAVGAIAFELRYPTDAGRFWEQFQEVTSIAGSVLNLAFASAERQRFAEQFARLLSNPGTAQESAAVLIPEEQTHRPRAENEALAALAEMAAGAAHELNNPLSVISGRAQLLAGAETDAEKKRILEQIQENANELSTILDDILAFARPEQPRRTHTDIKQMLDEAIQLASIKTKVVDIDAQIEVAEDVTKVCVDSAQVVSAIANVISNSIESYADKKGPVKITAAADESADRVKLQISDLGCGMDTETLQKATWPFFCGRPAGRSRGMGLTQAARLIQLNSGSLDIASEPGKGTTVTIHLPASE